GGEQSEPKDYERKPGVVLFRSTLEEHGLLVVFLVGETPTAGIQKTALVDALEQATRLCRQHQQPGDDCSEFRLLAPTFSGSVDSLIAAAQAWSSRPANPIFKSISGSATAVALQKLKAGLKSQNVHSSFASTVQRDDAMFCELSSFLAGMGIPLERVAILTEGSTAYGTNLRWQEGRILRMTYPLHISQLRTATEKSRREAAEAALETPGARPKNIPLSLDEGMGAADVITN